MQTKWVNDLNGQPFIEMIHIPSGYFTMGSNSSSYNSEKPEKEVFLYDYYISKYPITNKQFYHFIQETGYANSDDNFLQHWITNSDGSKSPPEELLEHPVVYVNWVDCYTFCRSYGLSLPSEAQWEKAARGSDKRIFPWGNDEPDTSRPRCNFRNIFEGTTPVGTFDGSRDSYNGIPIQKGTSPYGVEDMAGNVWEWCLDEWDSEWLKNIGENPINPCNYQKRERKGLNLNQVRPLSAQYQGVKGQRPFQEISFCGEALGIPTFLPTPVPVPDTVLDHYFKMTLLDSEVVSKQEAEEQNPFQDTEDCERVHGITVLPSTSVQSLATITTHRTGVAILDSDVVSKRGGDYQNPFRDTEDCGEVHTSTVLPLASVHPLASITTYQTEVEISASDAASKEEVKYKKYPFQDVVFCEEAPGSITILPPSVPPIATIATHHSETSIMASGAVFKQQEASKFNPFQDVECYMVVRGLMSDL